jgi:ribosome-associated protein
MKMVKITSEFITLGQFLKFTSMISSGAQAKDFLMENHVLVNDEIEQRRGRKLYPKDRVTVGKNGYLIEG